MKGSIRLDSMRVIVDEMLQALSDSERKRHAYVHLYGVSGFAAMLAYRRGLEADIAAIAGLLHNFYL